jgi:hypothetical protein
VGKRREAIVLWQDYSLPFGSVGVVVSIYLIEALLNNNYWQYI